MSEIAQLPAEHPWATLGVVAAILLIGWLRRPRGAGRAPDPATRDATATGDVWFAEVPFEDGSGSKDRPVLVLSVVARSCEVARFTSQDKNGRRDHVRVPQGIPGLPKASWLNLPADHACRGVRVPPSYRGSRVRRSSPGTAARQTIRVIRSVATATVPPL